MAESKLVIFDGNALIHRAYHAIPPLTLKKTGEMVNAAYGFVSMLLKVINEIKPTCYAIAFDRKAPTFRHQLFDRYKAQRPAMPEELAGQLGRVRQIVEAFRIPVFEMDGYEADDMLGSLSRQASEQGMETVIVTGDADAMQLVSPGVKVLYPKPRKSFSDTMLYDEAAVVEKYGVKPEQIADLKALQGDTSDNIPGVPGIGPKTALSLLQKFVSIDDIYNRIDEVMPPKLKEKLILNEAIARRSKELTTIVRDVPVKLDLNACRITNFDRSQVSELFREMEFFSLLNKLPGTGAAEVLESQVQMKIETQNNNYNIVNTSAALAELVAKLKSAGSFSFDTETNGLNPMLAKLVGISFSDSPGLAYYVPVGHDLVLGQVAQLPDNEFIAELKPVLESPDIAKIAHNGKFDMGVLAETGIEVNNLTFDTMVAAYLLGEKNLALKGLAFDKLGVEMTPITGIIGTGSKQIQMSQAEVSKVADYCGADADMTGRLATLLKAELEKQDLWQLFADVEMPLVPILLKMERHGVLLDKDLLRKLSRRLGDDLLKLEADIYKAVGHQFNINSSQQLSAVLFEELNLPKARKTASGYSTDASVIEQLRPAHPVIGMVLDYRQLAKLKSTYIDALPGMINPKTGRVHTSFNQTRTTTGRLSSSDPNLQNIPIRSDFGKQVRQAFIAPPGTILLAADYSQIDLRSLAHLSQDKALVTAFCNNEDVHTATAAQLYGVAPDNVKPDMRRLAKTVNFGVIYGMSEYGLEQATELSREDAGKFIKAYFEKYPQVREYLENTKQQARTKGYVQTILGRRRYIPEINSSNRNIREAAERMAINMPVQGTSADIIKVAMVKLDSEMKQRQVKSKMILQVHDELIFEVPSDELSMMRELVHDIMADAVKLSIPVKVDMKQGKNWGEME
ncbi:MAG: DNA polymerase I [Dehalococcoidales bacterium]|nr:DNA polymerase I [Dehalococcoidales bacterium]